MSDLQKQASIESVEQKTVLFYDDSLTAVRADDGHVYVALAQLAKALGLDPQAQTRRIRRHKVLEDGYRRAMMVVTPGGQQEAGVLRVDLVALWLTGVSTKSVSDEVRPKLERFQREAAKVLWSAFREGRLTTDTDFEALLRADSPAAQAYKMASAIMQMAHQQLLLESEVKAHEQRLADHEQRLEQVESTLGDTKRQITPDQATQISQAIKAIAMVLGKRSGRNEYGGVYGEFYRQFGIPGYKQLPANKFDTAMNWLKQWWQAISDGADIPF